MLANEPYLVIFVALLCFCGIEADGKEGRKVKFFKFGAYCDVGNEYCDTARHLRCDRDGEKCVCEGDLVWDPKASIQVPKNYQKVLKSRPAAENAIKGSCVAKLGDPCGEGGDHILVTCAAGAICVDGKNPSHG